METKSVQLSDRTVCELDNCVICGSGAGKLVGGPTGRQNVWAAAVRKKDAVYARILSFPNRGKYIARFRFYLFTSYLYK